MIRSFLTAVFTVMIAIHLIAQDGSNSIDLDIPSHPALNIIGNQTTEITRPGNYTGFYSTLISPIVSNSSIPSNLALEFSPYYMQSRDVTYRELGYAHFFRDFKLSVASNEVVLSDTSSFSRLGVGFRTYFLNGIVGNPTISGANLYHRIALVQFVLKDSPDIELDNQDLLAKVNEIPDSQIRRQVRNVLALESSAADADKKIEEILKTAKADVAESAKNFYNYANRTGHFVEFAGALALDFTRGGLDYSEINRWGIWLNYTYRPRLNKNKSAEKKIAPFDIGALVRFSNYSFDPSLINLEGESFFFDFGARIGGQIPNSKFLIETEIIAKLGLTDINLVGSEGDFNLSGSGVSEFKWDATIGYKITESIIYNVSVNRIFSNDDYFNNETQLLMGLSAALVGLKK